MSDTLTTVPQGEKKKESREGIVGRVIWRGMLLDYKSQSPSRPLGGKVEHYLPHLKPGQWA